MRKERLYLTAAILLAACFLVSTVPAWAQAESGVTVVQATQHAFSPPVDKLLPIPPPPAAFGAIPLHPVHPRAGSPGQADSVIQSSTSGTLAPNYATNFLGLGTGLSGFTVQYIPPDANLAAGPSQIVQWVNASFAVFNKATHEVQFGPYAGNTLWQSMGGACAANNSGDPIAQYDKLAGRWVMMQPVFKKPYTLCVAVSTTSDWATASWNLYSFSIPTGQFPDYPKLGVWPDAYYVTYNQFQGQLFSGPAVCAMDRNSMLNGAGATMQCFSNLGTSYGSLLPGDVDGATPPTAGEPAHILDFDSNGSSLDLWDFHVDWSNSANTRLSGPVNVGVAGFSQACGGGACVPQSGTSQLLDSLGDRLMYRLAYRNFGNFASLVVSHSVNTGNGYTGVRWYELRNSGSGFGLYQQSTFAPDANYRWMGSMAMDKTGNMALGYSVSSSAMSPTIRYTGRAPSDTLGQMQAEVEALGGIAHGSQTSYSRWGDYDSLSVDPVDDCTFWYTNEYQPKNGNAWSTRIISFNFGTCTAPSFTVAASPGAQTISAGSSTSYNVAVTPAQNAIPSVANGLPAGATATWSGSSGSYTLSVQTSASTPAGTYYLTLADGSGGTTATAVLIVTASAPVPSFSLSTGNVSATQGSSASENVSITPSGGFNNSVTLSASVPAGSGITVGFSPNPVAVSGTTAATSSMTVSASSSTPAGNYTITVTGTGGGVTSSTQFTLTVNAQAAAGFTLSASPGSDTVKSGTPASYAITVTSSGGFAGTVSFAVSGLPSGATASFSPATVTGSGSTTMTVNTSGVARGNYTLTVTGSSSGVASSSVSVGLKVR